MKAPLSKRVRKMLSNPELSRQLMKAILAERSNTPEHEKPTINVDGEELKLERVRVFNNIK